MIWSIIVGILLSVSAASADAETLTITSGHVSGSVFLDFVTAFTVSGPNFTYTTPVRDVFGLTGPSLVPRGEPSPQEALLTLNGSYPFPRITTNLLVDDRPYDARGGLLVQTPPVLWSQITVAPFTLSGTIQASPLGSCHIVNFPDCLIHIGPPQYFDVVGAGTAQWVSREHDISPTPTVPGTTQIAFEAIGISVDFAPIPEPSTSLLLGSGLTWLVLRGRRSTLKQWLQLRLMVSTLLPLHRKGTRSFNGRAGIS